MARAYPSLVERYPGYRDEVLRRRFQDKLLDELCRDYDRVVRALEVIEPESDTTNTNSEDLRALARKLEHEFLERLATHASSEHKTL